ncbi:MAG: caspase family protein, partial [Desulfobacterales bacterium]
MKYRLQDILALVAILSVGWTMLLYAQESKRGVITANSTETSESNGRYVVSVIGIDDYQYWPKLDNAVQDAIGTAKVLTEKFGFLEPVKPLLNEKATKYEIERLIKDELRYTLQKKDNFILFFAGHGHTRVDQVGVTEYETGFLVPVEAEAGSKEKWSQYIEIESLLTAIGKLPARHILVVLDSCHSGFALGAVQKLRSWQRYEHSLRTKISRKVITSARRDEKALDSGPVAGHSLFSGAFVEGLDRSLADLDDSDFITSSEIGLFLQQSVGRYSNSQQTPDFGSFYLDDRGEMVIPITIGNTQDAMKRRAFSALKRGEFDEVRRIVMELERQGITSPQVVYLRYRLDMAGRNPEGAYRAIENLYLAQWAEGSIPLSHYDVRRQWVRVRFWKPFLALPENDFPLDVQFYTGTSKNELKRAKPSKIGNLKGYELNTGDFMRLTLMNSSTETW